MHPFGFLGWVFHDGIFPTAVAILYYIVAEVTRPRRARNCEHKKYICMCCGSQLRARY